LLNNNHCIYDCAIAGVLQKPTEELESLKMVSVFTYQEE